MPNHRDEAIKAIEHVEKLLTGPELDPLGKKLALATLEVKKKRRVPPVQEAAG